MYSKKPQLETAVLFLSKCKPLGTIIQFILFYFQYHLSTGSHFSFSLQLVITPF